VDEVSEDAPDVIWDTFIPEQLWTHLDATFLHLLPAGSVSFVHPSNLS
jgi:hypothetical protein